MKRKVLWFPFIAICLSIQPAISQNIPPSNRYKAQQSSEVRMIPIAETKLIMEGIIHNNFRALEKTLRGKPNGEEAWLIIRGQALLIAESGNLLLLRPPKNEGKASWYNQSLVLRNTAKLIGEYASDRKLIEVRDQFAKLSNVCNSCHQKFQVKESIHIFGEESPRKE